MPGQRLSDDLKQKIIDIHLANQDLSYGALSERFGVAKTTVRRIVANYRERGSVTNIQASGRPRKTTVRDDRQIVREAKKNPFITAGEFTSVQIFIRFLHFLHNVHVIGFCNSVQRFCWTFSGLFFST